MTDATGEPAAASVAEAPTKPVAERLVEAAIEALGDLDVAALLTAVGVREIARRAGASTTGVYTHFGSLAGLADAVVARVFDPGQGPAEDISGLLGVIADAHFPLETGYAYHSAEFQRLTSDPAFRIRMGLWALGGPAVTSAYHHYLRSIDDRLMVAARALFARWGREVRPPFDVASFVAAQVALLNGTTVRHLVEPETFGIDHFKRAASTLTYFLLRVPGDRHDVDDRLTEVNYYPLDAAATRELTDRTRAMRARVLHAAAELFQNVGFERTTIAQIASHADTSTTSVYDHFTTKAGIAAALFRHQAALHLPGPDAVDHGSVDLVDHLTALAEFVRERAGYAGPYLYHVTAGTTEIDNPVQSALEELLRRAGHSDPRTAAEVVLIALIRRVLSHPGRPAREHAEAVVALLALPR